MFSYNEAFEASLKYFNGNDLAAKVVVDKYLLRNEKNELVEKTPEAMHQRIAKEFARIEKKKFSQPLTEEYIFSLLDKFSKIIPQGSPMSGIGNPYQILSLSNCFVVSPPHDSYGGICHTDQQIVQISKRRGGIGYDISKLRPKDLIVNNAARTTSGATSFMHRFSNTGREVGQGGRRAAQMITISVHHPDILDFIRIKNDETSITGANISVRLTDEFLNAVKTNKDYEQRWMSVDGKQKISRKVPARSIWKEIIHSAWLRAEPGILFWDNILKGPADCYEEFLSSSTNPCSEIPLSEYDSCRLIAINLFSYVKNPFTKDAYFDCAEFYHDAQIAQRLMDDLVDLEIEQLIKIQEKIISDPEPFEIKKVELELWKKIQKAAEDGRRTGLGITALGDTLAAIGLKYGSKKSIDTVEEIYKILKYGAYRSSVDMAKELGAFPVWDKKKEKDNEFLNRFKEESVLIDGNPTWIDAVNGYDLWSEMQKYGRRNVALLTTAPTGTLSILSKIGDYYGTTSGIEPAFMLSFTRRKKINHDDKNAKVDFVDKVGDKWTNFIVFHQGYQMWMDCTKKDKVEDSPYFESCAEEIDWSQRVKLQAAAQKHICHAISSTINLPEDVKEDEVAKIYETAWACGLKGMTVYRKNCRSGVLIENKKEDDKKRPKELPCDVHHLMVKGKAYFCLVGLNNGTPYEVFAGKHGNLDKKIKNGSITKVKKAYKCVFDDETEINPINMSCDEHEDALTRMVSISLRHGVDMTAIIEQLDKTTGELTSFAKCISRSLKKYVEGKKVEGKKCDECAGELTFSEGCEKCLSCGYSKCS